MSTESSSTDQIVGPTSFANDPFRSGQDAPLIESAAEGKTIELVPAVLETFIGQVGRVGEIIQTAEADLKALNPEPGTFEAADELRALLEPGQVEGVTGQAIKIIGDVRGSATDTAERLRRALTIHARAAEDREQEMTALQQAVATSFTDADADAGVTA